MLLFSGDGTHTDWSIGIELCTDETHIKSNSQCINDYYGLLNSWKSSVVAIKRSMPNQKIGVTEFGPRTRGPRFKLEDKSMKSKIQRDLSNLQQPS